MIVIFSKAHVHGHPRRLASGRVVFVNDYTNRTPSAAPKVLFSRGTRDDRTGDLFASPPPAAAAVAKQSQELITVRTVYGKTARIRRSDMESGRTLLRMYAMDGSPKVGDRTHLHRENIAQSAEQIADTFRGTPLINAAGGKPFKSPAAVTARVLEMKLDPVDYEVVGDEQRGFYGVLNIRA